MSDHEEFSHKLGLWTFVISCAIMVATAVIELL